MRLLTKTGVIFDRILGVGIYVAGVAVVYAWVTVCVDVVMRYFLGRPQLWVVQFSEYSLLYLTLLGAAWVLKREGHVKMEAVLSWFSPRTQLLINSITSIACAITCLVVAWYSAELAWSLFQRGIRIVAVIEVPRVVIVGIIPVGSFLLFIQFLRRTHGFLRNWRASLDRG